MKILIILKNFNQKKGLPGGVGNANEELGKELTKLGHMVDFLSREDDLKIFSFTKSIFPLRKIIKKKVKEKNYDVVYTQDWTLTFPLLFPFRIFKNQHFACFCGHQENWLVFFQNLVGKIMSKKLIVIGDELKRRFPNSTLVYRGINFEKFKPLGKKRDGIGWVEKGTEKLVLSEEKLKIIGNKNNLKTYIARGIPSDKMNDFYNNCKVFVSLPLKAGYNNVWNEAMASGVPIVIGNNEGAGSMLPIEKVEMKRDIIGQIDAVIKRHGVIDYREWLIQNGFSWKEKAKQLISLFGGNKNV